MRDGVASHRTSEDQKDRGKNGRLDHRERNAEHGLPSWGVQDGCRLLQVRIHIPEDAADQNVCKRRIMQTENDRGGEQTLTPPAGH